MICVLVTKVFVKDLAKVQLFSHQAWQTDQCCYMYVLELTIEYF